MPQGQNPTDVAGVNELQVNAKPELLKELSDGGAKQAIEEAKLVEAEVNNSAQQFEQLHVGLDSHVKDFAKKAVSLDQHRAEAGKRTADIMGEGKGIDSHLRIKAEKAIGDSLGTSL